jgi:hypothetical protein
VEENKIYRKMKLKIDLVLGALAYPVILLTALLAMLISRVCKLGQENAIHASIVASTSLQKL